MFHSVSTWKKVLFCFPHPEYPKKEAFMQYIYRGTALCMSSNPGLFGRCTTKHYMKSSGRIQAFSI